MRRQRKNTKVYGVHPSGRVCQVPDAAPEQESRLGMAKRGRGGGLAPSVRGHVWPRRPVPTRRLPPGPGVRIVRLYLAPDSAIVCYRQLNHAEDC
jgi:hypothetical protein